MLARTGNEKREHETCRSNRSLPLSLLVRVMMMMMMMGATAFGSPPSPITSSNGEKKKPGIMERLAALCEKQTKDCMKKQSRRCKMSKRRWRM